MIECPFCHVYWDYDNMHIAPREVRQRYKIKEQSDCIVHVYADHPTQILIEILSNEIDQIKKLIIAK